MDDKRLSVLLGTCIVPALAESAGISTPADLDRLYRSETYALLSDVRTGVWHLSAATLAEVLREELQTGQVALPEEQS